MPSVDVRFQLVAAVIVIAVAAVITAVAVIVRAVVALIALATLYSWITSKLQVCLCSTVVVPVRLTR